MTDQADMEARARAVLAETPHDPSKTCGQPNVVFARCVCDRQFRAMLAYAAEREAAACARAAEVAYVECAKTRHVRLGDQCKSAILSLGEGKG